MTYSDDDAPVDFLLDGFFMLLPCFLMSSAFQLVTLRVSRSISHPRKGNGFHYFNARAKSLSDKSLFAAKMNSASLEGRATFRVAAARLTYVEISVCAGERSASSKRYLTEKQVLTSSTHSTI